jgi:hypothetical protein
MRIPDPGNLFDPESGIQDEKKNSAPGSGINTPVPQHIILEIKWKTKKAHSFAYKSG